MIIIDIGKGVLAVWLIPGLAGAPANPQLDMAWLAAGCGAAAVIGHIWPFWHEYRGGKGAGTLVGVYAALAPKVLLPVFLTWVVLIVITGYVGISTVLAAAGAIAASAWLYAGHDALLFFGVAMAMLIAFAHRSNLSRMRDGTENRLEKAMLAKRRSP